MDWTMAFFLLVFGYTAFMTGAGWGRRRLRRELTKDHGEVR